MRILVTGAAGFIGYHVVSHFLQNRPDLRMVAVDNMNDYYDVSLKLDRLANLEELAKEGNLEFLKIDLSDKQLVEELFTTNNFDVVIHLAAQAGVRYARVNPDSYLKSNIDGFYNVIDNSAAQKSRFIYASSSSVYGANSRKPFKEEDTIDSPMSLYAATKAANEAIAPAYFYTHGLKTIGLRFFNVYGAWGRPDMAYYKWADAITNGLEIEVRNNGDMWRDMTYIDDVVIAIDKLLFYYDWNIKHEVFNIGNEDPVKIGSVLEYLKEKLHAKHLTLRYTEKGSEEPVKTFANTDKLEKAIGFRPNTRYTDGLDNFISWYKGYTRKTSL